MALAWSDKKIEEWAESVFEDRERKKLVEHLTGRQLELWRVSDLLRLTEDDIRLITKDYSIGLRNRFLEGLRALKGRRRGRSKSPSSKGGGGGQASPIRRSRSKSPSSSKGGGGGQTSLRQRSPSRQRSPVSPRKHRSPSLPRPPPRPPLHAPPRPAEDPKPRAPYGGVIRKINLIDQSANQIGL